MRAYMDSQGCLTYVDTPVGPFVHPRVIKSIHSFIL